MIAKAHRVRIEPLSPAEVREIERDYLINVLRWAVDCRRCELERERQARLRRWQRLELGR